MAGELRAYELLYILRPDLDEEQRHGKIAKVEQVIQTLDGQVEKTDEWGSRILAYDIRNFREGYYVLVNFTLPPEQVRELEGRFKMEDELLRYQVVRRNGSSGG
ncbi:MAG: 30S ribosomal protein S6 [Candidatus Bipolaricaulota bacterium]